MLLVYLRSFPPVMQSIPQEICCLWLTSHVQDFKEAIQLGRARRTAINPLPTHC